MKKLSCFPIVILLLFVFTGCDSLMGFLPNFGESVRTTVTEEEWLSALNSTNYTVMGSARQKTTDGSKVETNTITAKVTGTSCYRHQTKGTGSNKMEKKDYYTVIDSVNYHIYQTESGYVARIVTSGYADEKFGNVFSADALAIFNSLTHNAETKSYKGRYQTSEGDTYIIDIAFADGKVTTAHILCQSDDLEITYDFYDFGTTVVDLPEYTIAPQ